ncbi:Lin1244/Lin1753 domain-containing protein [Terrihalobacillus insolitus]|uniref:Lin1244/Lin1753 domain-containing protein n=1 Tax=Terrihalobacillus insolitus TaxID=2950438 RepID=UPI002340FEEF|nr:Lin1244/Lin1753 domain-containing protein [Terrihalobacillus insolitus]MDC3414295.1 DUF4373 domain-containing protein [Terrihalobacillus insolitus]
MPRPNKEGLDYFPLDVDIDQDDKIALIEAKHGLEGFAIVIKLFLKIYNNSYFYQWTEKEQLLFSKRVNVDINLVNDVINDCVKWGIFSEHHYNSYEILTSKGIQKRYLEAVSRRKKVKIPKKHLLLDSDLINAYKNLVIVDINKLSESVNAEFTPQRKQKENRKKTETERETENVSAITKFWDDNGFGFNNTEGKKQLLLWLDDSEFKDPEEIILKAMNIACANNKRRLNYIEGILKNWQNESLLTVEEVDQSNTKKQESKQEPDDDGYDYGF